MSISIELDGGGFLLIQQPTNNASASDASRWKLIVFRKMYRQEMISFAKLPSKGIPEFAWLSRYLSRHELASKQQEIKATFDLLRQFYPDGKTLLEGAEGLARSRKL